MSIKLIVDSASDITNDIAEKYDIKILPVTVSFSDGEYRDKIDISIEELYKKADELKELPKTAQITPAVFSDVFEQELSQNDQVIVITMGSKYSGTYNSAVLAKGIVQSDNLYIVDSGTITLGYGHLVYEVAKKLKEGCNIDEVMRHIDYCKENIVTFAMFDTLEYLKKGGRLSASKAMIGNILNIKLIVQIKEELLPMEKPRGMKKAMNWVVDYIKENNIYLKDKEVVVIHSAAEESAEQMRELLSKEHGVNKFVNLSMGAVVGTHAGPGAVGVSFLK